MTHRTEENAEWQTRAADTERWVLKTVKSNRRVTFADPVDDGGIGPRPPVPDDASHALPDASYETKRNALAKRHRAARQTLQEIENEMWELQYTHRQPSTAASSTHCPHPPAPDLDIEMIDNWLPESGRETKSLEMVAKEAKDEEERRREARQGQNIWARFDRHSQPVAKARREPNWEGAMAAMRRREEEKEKGLRV